MIDRITIDRVELSKMLILSMFILMVWLIMPILSILPLIYLCYSKKISLTSGQQYFILFIISLSFGFLGFTTESAGSMPIDMERYREDYFYVLRGLNFFEISPVNYGFNLVNWVLSNYFVSNDQMVGLFWVTLTYFFSLMSIHLLIDKFVSDRGDFSIILMTFILLIMPLVQVTEVLKQTAGFSIFLYGLSRKIVGKKGGWKWVFCAIMIHMSVLLILLTYFYDKRWMKKFVWMILGFSFIFLFVNLTDILMLLSKIPGLEYFGLALRIEAYADMDIFGGSRRYYILFVIYAISCILYILYSRKNKENIRLIPLISMACLCFTFSNQLTFARMIYTWYPFQFLLLIMMLDRKTVTLYSNRMIYFYSYSTFYILSNAIMIWATLNNTIYSQKYIGGGVINFMTSTVFDFLTYKVTNV